jgi:hypothetical protein
MQQEEGARIALWARPEEVDVGLKRVSHGGAPARLWNGIRAYADDQTASGGSRLSISARKRSAAAAAHSAGDVARISRPTTGFLSNSVFDMIEQWGGVSTMS